MKYGLNRTTMLRLAYATFAPYEFPLPSSPHRIWQRQIPAHHPLPRLLSPYRLNRQLHGKRNARIGNDFSTQRTDSRCQAYHHSSRRLNSPVNRVCLEIHLRFDRCCFRWLHHVTQDPNILLSNFHTVFHQGTPTKLPSWNLLDCADSSGLNIA